MTNEDAGSGEGEGEERIIASTVIADWAAVYTETLPRVYNYFRFRTGDNTLAEDLTAATFEQAWRGRTTYRHDRAAFTTWLFTIARHEAANYFRRPRGREVPLEYARQCDDARSVEDEVARRDDLARLVALLGQLPARERELIELKYGAALTNRAIAQVTGLSESNVGTLLGRVVHRLAKVWEETPCRSGNPTIFASPGHIRSLLGEKVRARAPRRSFVAGDCQAHGMTARIIVEPPGFRSP